MEHSDMDYGALASGFGSALSVGGSIFGALEGSSIANSISQDQQAIAHTEIDENTVRRNAMELSARRQQMQTVRQQQMARSIAQTAATSQGAQFGTGLQGAYGSISGQSNQNQLGVSQNLQFGEQMFTLDSQLDLEKMKLSQDQSSLATVQGISSMLGSIGKSTGSLYNLGTQLFS
jgi:hypothetical protein